MKVIAFVIYFLSLVLVSPNLTEIREKYPLASAEKEVAQQMHAALSDVTKEDHSVLVAYKGGIATLMAKHAKGVKDKKAFFQEGVAFLEHAVSEDPTNIEIRCIRLGVQENSPKFLKYKSDIENDKQFILEHFSAEPSNEIKDFVKAFVQQSSIFNPTEKRLF